MGMGIYMIWPAFYTDVTDSYRLPKRGRLRVDLGGIYFNAVVAVATLALWLAWRRDALLLLVGLQLLMMVKNLSPVIRSDGYHILADATGVPDLYAHIGPTLKRLVPGRHRDPSALTGRARALVTIWVLVVVPVLLSLMLGAVLLLPKLVTTAWDSGRAIAAGMGHESALSVLADGVRIVALLLPVLGSALVTQKLLRLLVARARTWSAGRPARRALVVGLAATVACGAAYAWWPSGQYQAIRPTEDGTLIGLGRVVASPASTVRPAPQPERATLAPGTHLAVAMVPVGGATKTHPAVYFLPAKDGDPPVAIVDDGTTAPTVTTTAAATTTTAETTSAPASTPASPQPVTATVFPFKLPDKPKPGDLQALATGTRAGGVTYDVVYSLVTVKDGAPVTNENSAYALASCDACTTVAVSFQVVLVVGTSKVITPIDVAEALNKNCPSCLTTAIADQIVVTLKSQPTDQLVARIQQALRQLDAIKALGAQATPAAIAAQVQQVQKQIDDALQASGQLETPTSTGSTTTTKTSTTEPATTATSPTTTEPATTATRTQTTTTAPGTTTTTTPRTATTTTATTTTEATTPTTTTQATTTGTTTTG
jgi:putative peptide zinc metalloprotease protein